MTIWEEIGRLSRQFRKEIRSVRVVRPVSPKVIREVIESEFDFTRAVPLVELVQGVAKLLEDYSIHVTHPRYFGLFNPSVTEAGIAADALVALYNPQLANWSHSPAANELERVTLLHLARALGLDVNNMFANFTTGGSEANLSAVLVALAHKYPQVAQDGVAAIQRQPLIYLTTESHHSFVKIARMSGLGTRSLVEVPVTSSFVFDTEALAKRIDEDIRAQRDPFMIVATAGTTAGGGIDPLMKLADVSTKFGAWFHVDAAWGGAACLVPGLSAALTGISRADSITWDAHKFLSVPMGAGMFFCRHREAVRRAFAATPSYMPPRVDQETFDPYSATVQWSRRAIGLKVFMTLAELGTDGLVRLLEHQIRMGDVLRTRLRASGWIIVNDTVLPLVCFTHPDIRERRVTTTNLLEAVYDRGKIWVSDVVLGAKERVFRACITSFWTTEEDIECLINEIEHARRNARQSL